MRNFVFVISSFLWLISSCNQSEKMDVKIYLEQDSTLNKLESSNQIANTPFALIFGFQGWEVQGADTDLVFKIVIANEVEMQPIFEKAKTISDIAVANSQTKNFVEREKNLLLSTSKSLLINQFGLIRKKGGQTCNFFFCSEAPGLIKLFVKVDQLGDIPISKMANQTLYYFIQFESGGKSNQFKGQIEIESP